MLQILKNRWIRKGLSAGFTTLAGLRRNVHDTKQIRILLYHRVDRVNGYDQLVVTPEAFEEQMDYLVANGYETINLKQFLSAREEHSTLPPRPIVLTFDDGFKDVYKNAFPILRRRGFTATVFPVTQWTQNQGETDHLKSQFDRNLFLSWEEIFELADNGFEIGTHTITHPLLPSLNSEEAWLEIYQSKCEVEVRLSQPVQFFCYPSGAFSEEHRKMVQRAGYLGACSIIPGPNISTTDPFSLRRTEISPRDDISDFQRKLLGGFDVLHHLWLKKTLASE